MKGSFPTPMSPIPGTEGEKAAEGKDGGELHVTESLATEKAVVEQVQHLLHNTRKSDPREETQIVSAKKATPEKSQDTTRNFIFC